MRVSTPTLTARPWLRRTLLLLLAIMYWVLGDVKRTYWIKDSPDGRFSTSLVDRVGWLSFDPQGTYEIYLTDNQTQETVLAATHPEFCGFERIALFDIVWTQGNHRFYALWTIHHNGTYRQHFQIEPLPLRVKAQKGSCSSM